MSDLFPVRPIDIVRTTISNVRDGALFNWHGRIYTRISQQPYGACVVGSDGLRFSFLGANAQVFIHCKNLRVQS